MAEHELTHKETKEKSGSLNLKMIALLILPLVALGGVILLFLATGGIQFVSPAPVEALTIERTVMYPGGIDIQVRNGSPEALTISQVIINDAIWPMTVSRNPIPRLSRATVHLDYHWSEGEAYSLTLFSSNAIPFEVEIPVAFTTPEPDLRTVLRFALIGLYVGVIPVFLGLFWFPALRRLGRRWMTFLMALTAGLLVFLGIDTLVEAVEQAGGIPGPFQGFGLIGIGAVGTFLLLDAISRQQVVVGRSETSKRLMVAYLISIGIGLHNLGEGLAIGAAYNVGEIALGAFLVIGFIIQNITEGLSIVAPVLRDRPGLKHLALMGLIAGVPAIFGAWLGGFIPSPTLNVLFLAIGTGAVFEVVYEVAKLIRRDVEREPMPLTVFSGLTAGMLVLWLTGLFIK